MIKKKFKKNKQQTKVKKMEMQWKVYELKIRKKKYIKNRKWIFESEKIIMNKIT